MEDKAGGMKVAQVGQGLLLSGGVGQARVRISTELRIRGAAIRVHRHGYLIPLSASADLLDLLPSSADWEPGALAIAQKRAQARRSQLEGIAHIETDVGKGAEEVAGLELLLPLDPHQVAAAQAIADPLLVGLALFDEQGTGKTFSTLAGFTLLRARGLIDRMLIVAPKSVLPAWASDADRLLGPELIVATVTGTKAQRRVAMRRHHDILVTNYESVVSELASFRLHLGASRSRYLLVVDESYFAKNPGTRRASALAQLRQLCPRAVVLSGTPAPNRPWDLVNQVELADGGIAYAGARRPATVDGERQAVVEGLTRAPYLRRLKTEVLPDLPSQTFTELRVTLAPEQRALYERAARDLALEVRSITDEAFTRDLGSFLARRSALLQICSHPGSLYPLYAETPGKLRVIDDLLRDLIEDRGEKVLLWSWFRFALDTVAARYSHYGVARVDGSVGSVDARADAIKRFQLDPRTRLFVGNAAAAGAGLTLTAARFAIYESYSNQAAHFMQSLDRIHRRGQERPVSYLMLISDSTVEEVEYERLVAKQRGARELLGDDQEQPPSRIVYLNDIAKGLAGGPHDLDLGTVPPA
jgi:SNF2 family DNA or RNA helicase